MECKIGEIFEYKGEWYQCLKSASCNECAFINGDWTDCPGFKCGVDDRTDNCSVIFKKLEKVGEPFSDEHVGLIQKYELRMYGYSTKDKRVCFADSYDVFIKIKQNKEDMKEKKLNLKPFDLQKAREGKPVYTRDGRKARIVCFDRINARPILALVCSTDGKGEDVFDYFISGKRLANALESDLDLMMLPEKKEGWAVIRKNDIYETEGQAEEVLLNSRTLIGVMIRKISWEE